MGELLSDSHHHTYVLLMLEGAEIRRPDNFADHLVDEKVAISQYSLSASVACGKVRRDLSFIRKIITNEVIIFP